MIYKLYEFVSSKKEIGLNLRSYYNNYIEHLLKLYLMPNNKSRNHWIKEIINYYYGIPRLKGKNRNPSYNFIYHNIFGFMEDTYYERIKNRVKYICYEYNLDENNIHFDEDEFLDIVQRCTKYFSNELSKRGDLDYIEAHNMIESILNN